MGRDSNKKRREQQASSARERAAAARAQQRQADQRRRAMAILSTVVVIALVGVGIAFAVINHKSSSASTPGVSSRLAAPSSVVKAVTSVSDATLKTVGKGNVVSTPAAVTGESPLTANGKPELLYIGAEFCPYCAIERWALAEALSKFGTFSNLGMVHSAADDGNYASLDFYQSTYTSPYLTFTSVENEDRSHNELESLTSDQNTLWNKLTDNSPGFPFLDFGNKLTFGKNVPLDPSVLGTMTQAQVAAQLNDPTSSVAKVISGGANADIAAICTMTGNKPASVCSTSTVTSLQGSTSG